VVALVDGSRVCLHLGRDVSRQFLEDVFGAGSLHEVNPAAVRPSPRRAIDLILTGWVQPIVPRGNPNSERLLGALTWLRTASQEYMPVEVFKFGDAAAAQFLSLLVEDKSQAMMGFSDFVAHIHKEVQK
jgi:hypothetical protein